jgi:hypothetical protein
MITTLLKNEKYRYSVLFHLKRYNKGKKAESSAYTKERVTTSICARSSLTKKIKEGLKASNAIIFTVYYYNTVLIGFPLLFIRRIYLLGIVIIRLRIFCILILFYFFCKAVLTSLLL